MALILASAFLTTNRQMQARLALCEAMTVLLLHQNKFPSLSQALPDLEVTGAMATNNISPHAKSEAMQQKPIDSPTRHFATTPTSTKPKTLLELADGDIDLLDESTFSNSAIENTHIEIDRFLDDHSSQPNSDASFAFKVLSQQQVFRNIHRKIVDLILVSGP